MEFKRLSDVEVVKTPADNANILIEDNGVIKKAPKDTIGNFVIINIPSLGSDLERATCNKTYNEVIKMYCDGTIDCVIIKGMTSESTFIFAIVQEATLLNNQGTVSISDVASAECIGFACDGLNIYYYPNGLSWDGPALPSPT